MNGVKYDAGKPDYSLVPPDALEEVVKALTYGAEKYGPHNWSTLDNLFIRYFSASMRHMWALLKGETRDPESGLHHAAHAVCCMLFIMQDFFNKSKE